VNDSFGSHPPHFIAGRRRREKQVARTESQKVRRLAYKSKWHKSPFGQGKGQSRQRGGDWRSEVEGGGKRGQRRLRSWQMRAKHGWFDLNEHHTYAKCVCSKKSQVKGRRRGERAAGEKRVQGYEQYDTPTSKTMLRLSIRASSEFKKFWSHGHRPESQKSS
jgi:hypothetical protein